MLPFKHGVATRPILIVITLLALYSIVALRSRYRDIVVSEFPPQTPVTEGSAADGELSKPKSDFSDTNGDTNTTAGIHSGLETGSPVEDDQHSPSRLIEQQTLFWRALFVDLSKYAPKAAPVIRPEDKMSGVPYNKSRHQARPDVLRMKNLDFRTVQSSHAQFVSRLKEQPYTLPFNKGTRGIVTTAGGPYLAVALVSLRMLRQTGSTLPVEVFLAKREEFDHDICGTIFPALNARCLVLQDIFEQSDLGHVEIDKYQYKIMSIMFSSFEDVIFLDSDCFPIHDPEPLLATEPFTSTGLVLWPDFWFPTESPLFFDIASIPAPDPAERASTESGQILYSKSRHDSDIILAAYYNYYGPDFYYLLQSQSAPGEGDKETFLWAAIALGKQFYHVQYPVQALGYITKSGKWRGSAMAQVDPAEDHKRMFQPVHAGNIQNQTKPRPFFIHANYPKFSPATIFQAESFGAPGPTRDDDGTLRRVWQKAATDAIRAFGVDVERRLWKEVRDLACEYELTLFKEYRDVCATATSYWNTVFGNEEAKKTDDISVTESGSTSAGDVGPKTLDDVSPLPP